jgi:hypothetical protein
VRTADRADAPLLSVVTPVLDRVSTIRECLASVARQTYPWVEHIVVDGGSTDGTTRALEEHVAERAFRWISEPDGGMYDALNKGLRMARGRFVSYLNSDDLYFPWSAEVAVDRLRAGADLVYGDLAILQRTEAPVAFYMQFYPEFDLRHYTHVATIGQPTVFWTRALTERIGPFDTTYRLIGDCEYWLRAATANARIEHVEEIQALQIDHGETLRTTQRDRLREEFERLRSHYGAVVAPPASPRFERAKKSVAWRRRQLEFRIAVRRRRPDRWPRFASFLRRRGIEIDDVGVLASMLPLRVRPSRSPWGDLRRLERRLMQEIGFDGHPG